MFQPRRSSAAAECFREPVHKRATGLVVAVALEALLLIALLTLGRTQPPRETADVSVITLSDPSSEADQATADAAEARDPERAQVREPRPAEVQEVAQAPRDQPAAPELPAPSPIEVSPREPAAADPRALWGRPRQGAAAGPKLGPGDRGTPADTPRVEGSGPNGEPLYAASWYREPYDSELSGYLSTARGPGWGLIACRTVRDFRVEDCIGLDEYPTGSNITRAVLAAAWQFRVRPPRRGGMPQVGEWVRIRIDYGLERRGS